jgi:GH35 family endo-1,4-beta-xylanase
MRAMRLWPVAGGVVLGVVVTGCAAPDPDSDPQNAAATAIPGPSWNDTLAASTGTLAAAAAGTGRLVGAAVDYGALINEPAYAQLLSQEFSYVTPENATKWGSVQPSAANSWTFTQADAIVGAAMAHTQQVKGHTFVWHQQLPPFVTDGISKDDLAPMVEKNIRTVMSRYGGQVGAWDVVNEAVADDGSGLRNTIFLRTLGPTYIEHAFRTAHDYSETARLNYNDYGIETINAKSNAVLAMVSDFVSRNIPIHGVGFQFHVDANSAPSFDAMVQNFRRFAALGLAVNVSELDVRVANVAGSRVKKLALQKQIYQRIVAACVATPGCESLTTWGFTDRHSWIDSTFGADDPLPFDDNYARKPAYYGMVDGFAGVPLDDPALPPNLIANATLEAGLDGWSTWGGATIGVASDHAHTGKNSARVSGRTAGWQGPVVDVTSLVARGRTYDASAWAQLGGASSDQVGLTAKVSCSDTGDQFISVARATANDGGFTQLAGKLAVPTCAMTQTVLYVESNGSEDLYADDIALRDPNADLGPNLVADPSFESGVSGWFAQGAVTIAATTAAAHSGAQSAVVTGRTATWNAMAFNLNGRAQAGTSYETGGWVRVGGVASADVYLTAKITCQGGSTEFRRLAAASATSTGWAQLAGTFAVPACASFTDLYVYFESSSATADIYVDDVSIRQQLAGFGPNLIANGAFETSTGGWFGFGPPALAITTAQAHGGASSLIASGRTDTWNGPATSLTSLVAPGKSYAVSAWVRTSSPTATGVRLSAKMTCAGTTNFVNIGSASASNAAWSPIAVTYTVPACPSGYTEITLYEEGPAAGVDLYLDDVSWRETL